MATMDTNLDAMFVSSVNAWLDEAGTEHILTWKGDGDDDVFINSVPFFELRDVGYDEWTSPEELKAVLSLLDTEGGIAHVICGKIMLNFNDTFYYACADGEVIKPKEAPYICKLVTKYGFIGAIAWAIKYRNRPWPEVGRWRGRGRYSQAGSRWVLYKLVRKLNSGQA